MKAAFSAVVTVVLLGIYVYLVMHAVAIARCISDPTCTALAEPDLTDRMASSLTLIAGLVAALVVAELSVTQPGQAPAARLVAPAMAKKRKNLMQVVTGLYLLVWLVTGLAAFLFGYLGLEEGKLTPLADLGQSWLGIAVGAGYAYFGIDAGGSGGSGGSG